MSVDLSVLIAARNEPWLTHTIESVLAQRRSSTEVIVVADGAWPVVAVPDHPSVSLIYHAESIGQRAAINQAARLAHGRFVMKLDAHCTLDEGFDVKLIQPYDAGELGPEVTSIPRMFNLHVFDWVCTCGKITYQGPAPSVCVECDSVEVPAQIMRWEPRWNRRSDFFRFDHTLHFQYWGSCEKRPESSGDLADVMSMLGAAWLMPRDWFWQLGGCDEAHGSWGQMGTELACKSWLSGGRLVVNKRTWFSHLFRTQPGFGMPYHLSEAQVERARGYSRDLWLNNRWSEQVRPLSWLIDKFAPIPGWHDADGEETRRALDATQVEQLRQSRLAALGRVAEAGRVFGVSKPLPVLDIVSIPTTAAPTVGVVYYTENQPDPILLAACRRQLLKSVNGYRLVSVSINGPAPIGEWLNIVLDLERGYLTMFKQILAGIEALDTDIVFLAEHDILYHPSHFKFRPDRDDTYYYNQNVWKADWLTGRALHYLTNQTSQLCAYRKTLLTHYRARVERVAREGYSQSMRGKLWDQGFNPVVGFEPGTRKVDHAGVDDLGSVAWHSEFPNVDVRHGKNLTMSRWRQDQFRDQQFCQGWKEADTVPGWGSMLDLFTSLRAT
jgi:glycosyltransferase involved in cell wall biosynthesis